MKPKYNVAVPFFPGFYNSILDSFIDREVEDEMENTGDEWEEVDKRANYQAARLEISRQWLNAFAKETGLTLEMEALKSPREYNFTTDRLFADMDQASLDKIKAAKDSEEFAKTLRDMFTSYDGFISFYSNDVEGPEWQKPVEEWDHNQLQALLRAYVLKEVDTEEKLLDAIHDTSAVYEAAQHVWNAMPLPSNKLSTAASESAA